MLVHWYPFADVPRFEGDVARIVNRRFGFEPASAAPVAAPVAVMADAEGVTVRAELPGVDPAVITLSVEGRVLTINAERAAEKRENGRTRLQERTYGAFTRALHLADDLDAEAISAKAEHGVLTVRIPKRAEAKPRRIDVKVS